MGAPISLLQGARAFARDFARDQMPKGYLWDCVDYVPSIIDASLTGRGGWRWGSPALGGDAETGILAPFSAGEQLLLQTSAGELMQVRGDTPWDLIADRGAIARGIQNPVFRKNETIWFDGNGASVPVIVRPAGGPIAMVTSGTAPFVGAPLAKVGCNWGAYLVVSTGDEFVHFAHPTNDLAGAQAWDTKSFVPTAANVTAIAALRAIIIVFHAGSTERIRGSVPPNSTTATADLTTESLFVSVGCPDPKAIAYWNENVIFADEHGVHITDGAVIRNLASQGGIASFWRPLFLNRTSLAASTFLDYYQITIGQTVGGPVTLICDLNKRQWFRFGNVDASCYVAGGGLGGMERVWAGIRGTQRLARVGPMYFPAPAGQTLDDNGVAVLPSFDTPWYRIAQEGRKRVRFVYLSYDVRSDVGAILGRNLDEPLDPIPLAGTTGPVLELSYIRGPQDAVYTVVGQLPFTSDYSRYRLPVGQFPYGVAFRVRQLNPSTVTRVFDIAVEAQQAERSRV